MAGQDTSRDRGSGGGDNVIEAFRGRGGHPAGTSLTDLFQRSPDHAGPVWGRRKPTYRQLGRIHGSTI
jgi:hypothetical protein